MKTSNKLVRLLVVVGAGVVLTICVCLPAAAALMPKSPTAAPTLASQPQVVAQATEIPPTQAAPTNTPELTNTPKPTDTPAPTKTFTPVPTDTATPAPIILEGKGDSVVNVAKWDGPALLQVTYTGARNFVVKNYDDSGESIDLLINTIGAYAGTRPIDFTGTQTARLEVQASGAWQIQILPLAQAKMVDIPGAYTGQGDEVILLTGSGRPDTVKFDASGAKHNFIVIGYGNDRNLLANEIAPYSGTVIVPRSLPTANGKLLLEVEATGPWSIEVTVK